MFPAFAHFRRTATRDTELHGQKIKKGEKVVMWYVSSNRDETRYEDPDRFDVHRNPEHQAFGAGGRHFCLGTALARLELRILIEETLARYPEIELDGEPRCGAVAVRQPAQDAAGAPRAARGLSADGGDVSSTCRGRRRPADGREASGPGPREPGPAPLPSGEGSAPDLQRLGTPEVGVRRPPRRGTTPVVEGLAAAPRCRQEHFEEIATLYFGARVDVFDHLSHYRGDGYRVQRPALRFHAYDVERSLIVAAKDDVERG